MPWIDALGNPVRLLLTPGQAHDLTGSDALLHITADLLIADRPLMPMPDTRRRVRRSPCERLC